MGSGARRWAFVDRAAVRVGRLAVPAEWREGRVRVLEKHVGSDTAYTVAIERCTVRHLSQPEAVPHVLRATMVFRAEDGEWKIAHRRADPLSPTASPWDPDRVVLDVGMTELVQLDVTDGVAAVGWIPARQERALHSSSPASSWSGWTAPGPTNWSG